jgi:hypothetical protein
LSCFNFDKYLEFFVQPLEIARKQLADTAFIAGDHVPIVEQEAWQRMLSQNTPSYVYQNTELNTFPSDSVVVAVQGLVVAHQIGARTRVGVAREVRDVDETSTRLRQEYFRHKAHITRTVKSSAPTEITDAVERFHAVKGLHRAAEPVRGIFECAMHSDNVIGKNGATLVSAFILYWDLRDRLAGSLITDMNVAVHFANHLPEIENIAKRHSRQSVIAAASAYMLNAGGTSNMTEMKTAKPEIF